VTATAAEILAVAVGYAAGAVFWTPLAVPAFACMLGMALALLGIFLPQPTTPRLGIQLSGIGLCVYCLCTDHSKVLLVADTVSLLVAIVWLAPVIMGGLVLARHGAWLAGAGCALTLFSGVAVLGYNVSHWTSVRSFFFGWDF
jgi:hypothetical protein